MAQIWSFWVLSGLQLLIRHANFRDTPTHCFELIDASWSLSSFLLPPSSFLLPPSSFILHPSSFILHPSSFILHPSSFILHPSDFILLTSSF